MTVSTRAAEIGGEEPNAHSQTHGHEATHDADHEAGAQPVEHGAQDVPALGVRAEPEGSALVTLGPGRQSIVENVDLRQVIRIHRGNQGSK